MTDLDWRNVHGIGFDGGQMDDTRENKVKVLNQIRKGEVKIEDSELDLLVLYLDEIEDYVEVFYSEDNAEQAIQEMAHTIERIENAEVPTPLYTEHNLKNAVSMCKHIYEPDLPNINNKSDVLAYCV